MFKIWNFAMIVRTFPPLNFRVTKFLIFTFVYSFFDRKVVGRVRQLTSNTTKGVNVLEK